MRIPRSESLWWPDGRRKQFCVYILSNNSMKLYTGITNNLKGRTAAHLSGNGSSFTRRYHFDRLVYFEIYDYVVDAIAREKQIKGLTRAKKIALVKTKNRTWSDLSRYLP